MCWKALPEEERQVWKEKARRAMEEHKRLYPSYRYNPRDQQNRTQSAGRAKRKVKEISGPPPDPERIQEIARMLVEGKKGDDLEHAVNQFDENVKVHSPERARPVIQARFDAPMTESTFRRRSTSLPPPPKDEESAPRSPVQTKPKKISRKRSSSAGTKSRKSTGSPRAGSSAKPEDVEDRLPKVETPAPSEIPFRYYSDKVFVRTFACPT